MNINRNNYETIFMLYVDNELSAEEKIAVEKFVANNADLRVELDLLLNTTLPFDGISCNFKNTLLKEEENSKLSEMISLMDDELDKHVAADLRQEISANADLLKEWNNLQRTKLDPEEHVVFPDKKSLYRKERDNVFYIQFRKIAIAAAVIGIGIFIGLNVSTDVGGITEIAAESKVKKTIPVGLKTGGRLGEVPGNSTVRTDQDNTKPASPETLGKPTEILASATEKKKKVLLKNTTDSKSKEFKPEEELVKKETNNLPKPYYEKNIEGSSNNITLANVEYKKEMNGLTGKEIKPNAPVTIVDLDVTQATDSYGSLAVMNESGNNNKVLFLNEETIGRSKVGAAFKKFKRIVSRNANIKSGKSIKIAGFEFAAR